MNASVPTLYEWLGGLEALKRLTTRFYERVRGNSVLAPIFAHMSDEHPQHVAAFLAEVLGGPPDYSANHGGHPHMVRQHLNRHLTQARGSRLAVLNSQTGATVDPHAPMPKWGWGEVKGPYVP